MRAVQDAGAQGSIWGTAAQRALRNSGAQQAAWASAAEMTSWDTPVQRTGRGQPSRTPGLFYTASVKLGEPAVKPPALARGTEVSDIAGLSAFYTPNSQFYRIDTALVVPQVSPQAWQLRIHGMVDKPMTITFGELMKRPMIDHDVTLCCVSEGVGGGFIGNARWQGALLAGAAA